MTLTNLVPTDRRVQSGMCYVVICTLEGATVHQLITQPHYCTENNIDDKNTVNYFALSTEETTTVVSNMWRINILCCQDNLFPGNRPAHGQQRRCQEDPVSLPSGRLEKTTRTSPHHVAQHHPTGSETPPPYAPRCSRVGSEPPSVEDDVDVLRYAIVSCMPETTTTNRPDGAH